MEIQELIFCDLETLDSIYLLSLLSFLQVVYALEGGVPFFITL